MKLSYEKCKEIEKDMHEIAKGAKRLKRKTKKAEAQSEAVRKIVRRRPDNF